MKNKHCSYIRYRWEKNNNPEILLQDAEEVLENYQNLQAKVLNFRKLIPEIGLAGYDEYFGIKSMTSRLINEDNRK